MQKPAISLDGEKLIINGHIFTGPTTSHKFENAIGEKGIIDTSMPSAPWGYKNNVRYLFPSLGITFTENHATGKVNGITCIYDPENDIDTFNGFSVFPGLLEIYGTPIDTFQYGKDLKFHSGVDIKMLVNWWIDVSVGITCASFTLKGKKLPSKRRSKNKHVISANLSFKTS